MQSILQKRWRMSIEDGQCHVDFISCERGWRFYFTPQPRINLYLSSFQGKLSNVNSLQSSFSTTTTFNHSIEQLTVFKQCFANQRDLKSILMTFGKSLQARLAILLLFMWLNLVKSTKLPTYPGKLSSHYVVQQILIFMIYFWIIFLVILFSFGFFFLIIIFYYTKGRAHVCNPYPTPHGISWLPITQ